MAVKLALQVLLPFFSKLCSQLKQHLHGHVGVLIGERDKRKVDCDGVFVRCEA